MQQPRWHKTRCQVRTTNGSTEPGDKSREHPGPSLSRREQAVCRVQRYLDDLEVLMLEDLQDLAEPLQQAFDLTDDPVKRNGIIAVCCLSMALRTQVQDYCTAMQTCFGGQYESDMITTLNARSGAR